MVIGQNVRRIFAELPFVGGVVAACVGLWWHGRAFVPMKWPAGFDWERYVRETWAYLNPGTMNSTWLEPLYPWVFGNLGPELGWAWAGALISSVSMVLVVLGAGLLGRVLGGPWCGAVAAIAIPLTPQLAHASRWVNMYPMLSGLTALGLACTAAFARWPRWYWACMGGIGIGLAWAVDSRTITLLPGMILLAGLGAWGVQHNWRRVLLMGLFVGGLMIGPYTQNVLRVVPRESTTEVAEILRGIELSKIRQGPDGVLKTACEGEPSTVISPYGLTRPCAAALQADNEPRIHAGLPVGLTWSLWLLPFAFLPSSASRRRSIIAVLTLVPALAMTWVMSRWIIVTPRYMMQIAAPAAVIAPLAVIRIWTTVLRQKMWRQFAPVGAVGIGVWLFTGGVGHMNEGPLESSSTYKMMSPIVTFIEQHVGPEDTFLDCSESHIEVSLLPKMLHALPSNHEGHDWPRCASWITSPEGKRTAYIVLGDRTRIENLRGPYLPPPWQLALRTEGQGQSISLWKLER